MHELTLEWTEIGQRRTYTIGDRLLNANHAVRIGRDPGRCDLVLQHPSISGLHVEIFFAEPKRCFCLRNLRESNPPIVDGQTMVQSEATIQAGSTISLGQVTLRVVSVTAERLPIPPTLLFAPHALEEKVLPQPSPAPVARTYGLRCSRCRQISPYQQLETGCRWCGASLAAAASVLMAPDPL